MDNFEENNQKVIDKMSKDLKLQQTTRQWVEQSSQYEYSYHFTWMGRPIIQFPQDIIAMQELIWTVKPDLIVETGIARGGSLVFYASMLELLGGDRQVVGIDIDIREHNKKEILGHPMSKRIQMIEGSSIDTAVVDKVFDIAKNKKTILVTLDSNHTHEHVYQEMKLYSPLVTLGSYMVVFDTVVDDMPSNFFPDRPWDKTNNPKTAVRQFLQETDRFEVDKSIEDKLLITVAPQGYLKCLK